MSDLYLLLISSEFIWTATTLVFLLIMTITLVLKCSKIVTYLYEPNWVFKNNLTIAPLIKDYSLTINWTLTILLIPIIIAVGSLKSPFIFVDYLQVFTKSEGAVIIISFIYIFCIVLLSSAFLERILPRRIYSSRKQLWVDLIIYSLLLCFVFLCIIFNVI